MVAGYTGKMLFVDLTSSKLKEKELTEELAWNFLGGYGLGAKILYEMMPAGTDPLGPTAYWALFLARLQERKRSLADATP